MSKLVIVLVAVALLALVQRSVADIFFKRQPTSEHSVESYKDKGVSFLCIPGRTIIKFEDKGLLNAPIENNSDEDDVPALRSHMNYLHYGPKDESCQICVCSAEGQDEYCVRRPAINVNECLVIKKAKDEFTQSIPFSHDRDITQMIRRDYIWHKGEIPYEGNAKCYRGTSYYTNDPKANDTDIGQVPSDIESILSYENLTICYFCICSTSGNEIACIPRQQFFCDYYRMLGRDDQAMRDTYTSELGEDRPAYFRLLSQRMRRTFDEGVYDLIETAGSKLEPPCVPFLSEYTDCNKDNQCTGCKRCTCSVNSTWECKKVRECQPDLLSLNNDAVDYAMDNLLEELGSKKAEKESSISPINKEETVLVTGKGDEIDLDGKILSLLREKRSTKIKRKLNEADIDAKINGSNARNGTITFYHTVDELNEDVLQNTTMSGTVEARKVDLNILSRRLDTFEKANDSFDKSLQIEYTKPQNYHQNIDNKIDGNHSDYIGDLFEQKKLGIITNHTQKEKDTDLSKIIVNELKIGSERVGDQNAPVISNITFTPENDTLTAMAFIAGNLLNKLWQMEKEASEESLEIEAMKNEKVQDLLDLFKEPLTMRQEAFLKNALESLTKVIDQHKDGKNISICESISEAKHFIDDARKRNWEKSDIEIPESIENNDNKLNQQTPEPVKEIKNSTFKAISKINDVLRLMKKYELVQKNLYDKKSKKAKYTKAPKVLLKSGDHSSEINLGNGTNSLNLFGNILEKITKLLLPYKSSKKMVHKIKNVNMFVDKDEVIKKKIKDIFNTDVGNTTMTMKDKIILDYLIHMKKNPRSLFDENSDEMASVYIEKDILLNLSEFFKMRSLTDLVKLLDVNKSSIQNILNPKTETTTPLSARTSEIDLITSKAETVTQVNVLQTESVSTLSDITTQNPKKFANTKEKFKAHLRTILEDLVELKKEAGDSDKDLKLSKIFPCIYNILIGNNSTDIAGPPVDPYKKLAIVFEELKKEFHAKSLVMTRRMNSKDMLHTLKQTPESAYVWERVIKNINKQRKQSSRRNSDITAPKPLKELLQELEKQDVISSINNEKLLKKTLDLKDHIIMLKAFYAENQRNFDTLKDIKASLDIISSLSKDQQDEIVDFIDKAAYKIKFHNKVLQQKEKHKNLKATPNELERKVYDYIENVPQINKVKGEEIISSKNGKQIQLTREAVMNHLIRNRVNSYLKVVNAKDPNYMIAKSILLNLDNGETQLAKQLYKIFVTTKRQNSLNAVNDKSIADKVKVVSRDVNRDKIIAPVPIALKSNQMGPMSQLRRTSILEKEPIIQFEDPTYYASNLFLTAKRDQTLRKMLNKNLNFQ